MYCKLVFVLSNEPLAVSISEMAQVTRGATQHHMVHPVG